MSGLLYGIFTQFKIDIRSKNLLVTCYLVPILFFLIMGAVYTSIMPESKDTLIQTMTVMAVSLSAIIGTPPAMIDIYRSDVKKMYYANGIPMYFGVFTIVISTFIHLMITSAIIFALAPMLYHANTPSNVPLYFFNLAIFIIVTLSVSCVLGLSVKNQAKLTVYSQIIFLPSVMLSGIMFSADLLPKVLQTIAKVLPATWGNILLLNNSIDLKQSYL